MLYDGHQHVTQTPLPSAFTPHAIQPRAAATMHNRGQAPLLEAPPPGKYFLATVVLDTLSEAAMLMPPIFSLYPHPELNHL